MLIDVYLLFCLILDCIIVINVRDEWDVGYWKFNWILCNFYFINLLNLLLLYCMKKWCYIIKVVLGIFKLWCI